MSASLCSVEVSTILVEFVEAQEYLNEYMSSYGKNKKEGDKLRIMATSYFQAANYSRLQEWTKSAELLDKFFENYPDPKSNVYYPFALFRSCELLLCGE